MLLAKLKDSTGEACNNLKAKADAHTLFLFMNGFDFVNPPSYKDNHRVDPNCLPKEKASASLLQNWLGRQGKETHKVVEDTLGGEDSIDEVSAVLHALRQ